MPDHEHERGNATACWARLPAELERALVGRGRAVTPEAKREIVERIYAVWLRCADWRLGQLLICGLTADAREALYGIEDAALAALVESRARRPPETNDRVPQQQLANESAVERERAEGGE